MKEASKKIFSEEEVIRFRTRYKHETAKQIYESEGIEVSMDSFQKMLRGYTYKEYPVFGKSDE
jgi:hypothetical protein